MDKGKVNDLRGLSNTLMEYVILSLMYASVDDRGVLDLHGYGDSVAEVVDDIRRVLLRGVTYTKVSKFDGAMWSNYGFVGSGDVRKLLSFGFHPERVNLFLIDCNEDTTRCRPHDSPWVFSISDIDELVVGRYNSSLVVLLLNHFIGWSGYDKFIVDFTEWVRECRGWMSTTRELVQGFWGLVAKTLENTEPVKAKGFVYKKCSIKK